MISPNKA